MAAPARAPESVTVAAGAVALGARHWAGATPHPEPPVLLVHGLSSNARLWDGVARHLEAAGHPVLAVDLRGHGSSASVPDSGATGPAAADPTVTAAHATLATDPTRTAGDPTRTAAADLAAVCAGLGWTQMLVGGQSWGGNVVLQLAADQPELVHALVLVDGGWLHLGDRFTDIDAAWRTLAPPDFDGWTAARLGALLTELHPGWPPAAIDATLANLEHRPDGTIRPWLPWHRHRAIVASLLTHRPRSLYPGVRCRAALLVAGDPPDPLATEALAALPAGSTLVAFAGGDHDLHAQYPDRVAAAIGALA